MVAREIFDVLFAGVDERIRNRFADIVGNGDRHLVLKRAMFNNFN